MNRILVKIFILRDTVTIFSMNYITVFTGRKCMTSANSKRWSSGNKFKIDNFPLQPHRLHVKRTSQILSI